MSSTGFWIDRSQSPVLGATITLPIDQAHYVLTSLTLLITLAWASFWNLTALLLHRRLAAGDVDVLGLQHRVTLLNLHSSFKVILESIKIYHSWLDERPRNLGLRTLGVLVPAGLVWGVFSTASILSSRVALTGRNGDVVSPIRPNRCGLWSFDTSENSTAAHLSTQLAFMRKIANDTLQARNYVSTFYNRASISPMSLSRFKSATLPMEINASARCPFSNPDRCQLGRNGALSMTAPLLNSHHAFGINAYPADQVSFQYKAICSPIRRFSGDYQRYTEPPTPGDISRNFIRAFFGPSDGTNFTHQLYEETVNTQAGYFLQPFYARANDSVAPTWTPTADFNRTDADVTMFFLSQNNIIYLQGTFDPWFLANGSYQTPLGGLNGSHANYFITAMACTEQFRFCNPIRGPEDTDTCLPSAGLASLQKMLLDDGLASRIGFNTAQRMTAMRIATHMTLSTLYYSVISLRGAALWANSLVYANLSPGLPDNQWQLEALGWFQTSLVKLQSYISDFATNPDDLGPHGKILSPVDTSAADSAVPEMHQDQCANQLVRTTGEMQNLSFLGITVIVCCSVLIIFLDMTSGMLTRCLSRRRARMSAHAAARQTDGVFHLTRQALRCHLPPSGRWALGHWDIPVWKGGNLRISEQYIEQDGGLMAYRGESTAEGRDTESQAGSDSLRTHEIPLRHLT